ncbi:methylmalonyl-CoA decarboxylase [Ruficoccus amylovorans]|uniref:Methylmalonyl-CoA decarboxylase n=1 Tax=Ruficoccus amylovorans TaxID=1804625 RepID=A0A842HFT2_9BACT|nr:methylmalonyl-CoA decarboxylase [Ruficoccus amylovorans]MBC2595525.1 methylmalonyl-CoA decarboxylase [Ruficoccus amylovorans]
MALVTTAIQGKTGIITFSNPEARNCLSGEMVEALVGAFDELEKQAVYAVILRAEPGVKVWSAGHNIKELPEGRRDPLNYYDSLGVLLRRVQDFPYPVIAMVEGTVWGGACDLCISCDMIVCAENATFAITPAKLGLPYNASGVVHFINVLGPKIAKEMFFTAKPISARQAHNVSMVNHVVPAPELEGFTLALADSITANAPLAIRVIKHQFRLLLKGTPLPAETFEEIQGLRRRVYDSDDYKEGVLSFKEKRPPVFTGR